MIRHELWRNDNSLMVQTHHENIKVIKLRMHCAVQSIVTPRRCLHLTYKHGGQARAEYASVQEVLASCTCTSAAGAAAVIAMGGTLAAAAAACTAAAPDPASAGAPERGAGGLRAPSMPAVFWADAIAAAREGRRPGAGVACVAAVSDSSGRAPPAAAALEGRALLRAAVDGAAEGADGSAAGAVALEAAREAALRAGLGGSAWSGWMSGRSRGEALSLCANPCDDLNVLAYGGVTDIIELDCSQLATSNSPKNNLRSEKEKVLTVMHSRGCWRKLAALRCGGHHGYSTVSGLSHFQAGKAGHPTRGVQRCQSYQRPFSRLAERSRLCVGEGSGLPAAAASGTAEGPAGAAEGPAGGSAAAAEGPAASATDAAADGCAFSRRGAAAAPRAPVAPRAVLGCFRALALRSLRGLQEPAPP